jgi:hypothetical protein
VFSESLSAELATLRAEANGQLTKSSTKSKMAEVELEKLKAELAAKVEEAGTIIKWREKGKKERKKKPFRRTERKKARGTVVS